MITGPRPEDVRQLVTEIFASQGVQLGPRHALNEHVRIDRGRCVARTYRAGGLMAMWFVDYGLLQCYDAQGAMLRAINLLQALQERRQAA